MLWRCLFWRRQVRRCLVPVHSQVPHFAGPIAEGGLVADSLGVWLLKNAAVLPHVGVRSIQVELLAAGVVNETSPNGINGFALVDVAVFVSGLESSRGRGYLDLDVRNQVKGISLVHFCCAGNEFLRLGRGGRAAVVCGRTCLGVPASILRAASWLRDHRDRECENEKRDGCQLADGHLPSCLKSSPENEKSVPGVRHSIARWIRMASLSKVCPANLAIASKLSCSGRWVGKVS